MGRLARNSTSVTWPNGGGGQVRLGHVQPTPASPARPSAKDLQLRFITGKSENRPVSPKPPGSDKIRQLLEKPGKFGPIPHALSIGGRGWPRQNPAKSSCKIQENGPWSLISG